MKMSKETIKRLNELQEAAGKTYTELDAAVASYNDGLQKLNDTLSDVVEAHNAALEAFRDALDDERQQFQDEHDEKSDAWQEGEKGQEATSFIDSLEEVVSELDAIEVEYPDAIEVNANNPAEQEFPTGSTNA